MLRILGAEKSPRLSVPLSRLSSPRGNLRRLPQRFSRLLSTALSCNIPLASATHPYYDVCNRRQYILLRDIEVTGHMVVRRYIKILSTMTCEIEMIAGKFILTQVEQKLL